MSLMRFNDPLPFLSKIAHTTNFRIKMNYNPPSSCTVHPSKVALYTYFKSTPPNLSNCTSSNCTVHLIQLQGAPPSNYTVHPPPITRCAPPPIVGCTPSNCTAHSLQMQGAPPPKARDSLRLLRRSLLAVITSHIKQPCQ